MEKIDLSLKSILANASLEPRFSELLDSKGKDFTFLGEINTTFSDSLEGSFINDYIIPLENIKAQYIKLKAINYGFCPDWHLGAGGKTWLFVDEIIIH